MLDGEDARIGGGTGDELDHRVERFIGMVEEDVVRSDLGEQVVSALQAPRHPRRERRVVEEWVAGELVELPQAGEVERTLDPVDLAVAFATPVVELFVIDDRPRHRIVRRPRRDLDPHRLPALARLEPLLDELQHVVRLLLEELKIAVSRNPEGRPGEDGESTEELGEPGRDEILEEDETVLAGDVAADIHKPRQDLRHLDDGKQPLGPEPLLLFELGADVEPAVVVARRGMGRIDRHRREDRQRPLVEESFNTRQLLLVKVAVAHELEALGDHRRGDALREAAVLPGDKLLGAVGDPAELFQRAGAVRGRVLRGALAERLLAHPRDAHHEKLVEVRAEDGEELQPFHEGIGDVLGLLEDAEIEVEPAQLPVDEALGGVGDAGRIVRFWHGVGLAPVWWVRPLRTEKVIKEEVLSGERASTRTAWLPQRVYPSRANRLPILAPSSQRLLPHRTRPGALTPIPTAMPPSTPLDPSSEPLFKEALHFRPGTRGWCVAAACRLEATAQKPGNVHPGASFPDLDHAELVAAGRAIAPAIEAAPSQPLGRTILAAVSASRRVTRSNANLGIILAIAPLASVPGEEAGRPFRPDAVAAVLARLTPQDAADTWEAITLAAPGGMGRRGRWDLAGPAPHDRIARLWTEGWGPLEEGLVADLLTQFGAGRPLGEGIVRAFLLQLAREPDTLIARRHGPEVAAEVSRRAAAVVGRPGESWREAAADLDRSLRHPRRINPGTTADLCAAALYILLRDGRLPIGDTMLREAGSATGHDRLSHDARG